MYLTVVTRPIYPHEYQVAFSESHFWCIIVFHKSIIKQGQEENDY